MYHFKKLRKFKHVTEGNDTFVFTAQSKRNQNLLEKVLKYDRSVLVSLVGKKGTGKHSFLANALKNEDKNIKIMHSSELTQSGKLGYDILIKNLRSITELINKETQKIIEGEVFSITANKIHLKTMDMDSVFDVGVRMRKELERERINIGDVIKIRKENCYVTKIGRASNQNTSFRYDLLPIVPIPEGECIKNEISETTITLDELDVINSNENGEENLCTNQLVSDQIQIEVDKRSIKWIKEGRAILKKGILIIEDCEQLPIEILKFIQSFLNSTLAPHVFLIFNEKILENTGIQLKFDEYSKDQLQEIILENTKILDESTREILSDLAIKKGLSFAFKILNSVPVPATTESVKKISSLFNF